MVMLSAARLEINALGGAAARTLDAHTVRTLQSGQRPDYVDPLNLDRDSPTFDGR
jgi:hypothetical protein